MAIREEKKENDRLREAYIDEKNKPGPPMMIEIEANQNQVEENTRQMNKMQGDENYALMLSNRQAIKRAKEDSIAEFNAKY